MAFILQHTAFLPFLPVPAVLSVPEFSAAFLQHPSRDCLLQQFQFTVPYFYFVPDLAIFPPL